MGLCQYVDLCFHALSLPCLHTSWHVIPTSFYILFFKSYFLYNLDVDAYNSSMAFFCPASLLPLYHLASTWHQLLPISTPLLHGFNAIPVPLHFTLHPMTMLNVTSWIVHLTPIPCSLFHLCPNLARLPHYVQLVGFS